MSDNATQMLDLATDADTRALASDMAPGLGRGDLVTLSGPIGAGKTEFCRALIRARAGAEIEVPSPSFTLIQTYALPDIDIAHVDLYRLADPSELVELGLDELAADHLVLLEWPERAEGALPPPTVALTFSIAGIARLVEVRGRTDFLAGRQTSDA